MNKLSENQINEIKRLMPLNANIIYDEDHIQNVFKRLERVLINSHVAPENVDSKPTKEKIKAQTSTIKKIQENLKSIQRGVLALTPINKSNLDDTFSFEIFSEIKLTKEKVASNPINSLSWHRLDMEKIFKALAYKAEELEKHMNERKNRNAIFYEHLCDFWENERLSHKDITSADSNKFVQLAAILLSKSIGATQQDIKTLRLQEKPDTYIYLDSD